MIRTDQPREARSGQPQQLRLQIAVLVAAIVALTFAFLAVIH